MTVIPLKPSTSPVKRRERGTAEVSLDSILKTRIPQPSVSYQFEDHALLLQSELDSET